MMCLYVCVTKTQQQKYNNLKVEKIHFNLDKMAPYEDVWQPKVD